MGSTQLKNETPNTTLFFSKTRKPHESQPVKISKKYRAAGWKSSNFKPTITSFSSFNFINFFYPDTLEWKMNLSQYDWAMLNQNLNHISISWSVRYMICYPIYFISSIFGIFRSNLVKGSPKQPVKVSLKKTSLKNNPLKKTCVFQF